MGRGTELANIKERLATAKEGQGNSLFIIGDAGIGKTHLVNEVKKIADRMGICILENSASGNVNTPLGLVTSALEKILEKPLHRYTEYTKFDALVYMDLEGNVVEQLSRGNIDVESLSGVVDAVQNFLDDSFDLKGGLDRLDYGNIRIVIERNEAGFLLGVFEGKEHGDMGLQLKIALNEIGEGENVKGILQKLGERRFLTRRELERVKLTSELLIMAEQALSALVKRSSGGILLILEDIHWADSSSLFVIDHLCRNIASHKIVIICTLRPGNDAVVDRVNGMVDSSDVLSLGILDTKDILKILRPMLNEDVSDDDAKTFYKKSGGNPLFAIELAKQVREKGLDVEVPSTVEEVLQNRLYELDEGALGLAEYASCMGVAFEKRAVMHFEMTDDVEKEMARLIKGGILQDENGKCLFIHTLFQEILYRGIEESWKLKHHKSIGEYLEQVHAGNMDDAIYEIAWHFGNTNDSERAFEYNYAAGAKAESVFAPDKAMQFYRKALLKTGHDVHDWMLKRSKVLERMGDVDSVLGNYGASVERYLASLEGKESILERAEIHRRIADILLKMGRLEDAKKQLQEGLNLIKDQKETIEYARLLLTMGWGYGKYGDFAKAKKYMQEGLERASRHDMEGDMAYALHSCGSLSWWAGNLDDAQAYLEKAVEMRRRMEDIVPLASSLNNLGGVYHYKGDMDVAISIKKEALDLYKKAGEQIGIAVALNNVGIAFYDKGDLKKCIMYYKESLEIRKRIGDLPGQATSHHNIAIVYLEQKDVSAAREEFYKALSINRAIDSKIGMIYDILSLGQMEIEHENIKMGETLTREGLKLAVDTEAKIEQGWARRILGICYKKKGMMEEARQELEIALKIFEKHKSAEDLSGTHFELGMYWEAARDMEKARIYFEKSLEGFLNQGNHIQADKAKKELAKLDEM